MKIRSHEDLEVFQLALEAAMEIFEISQRFPKEEKYSLTDQIRRSSRSVCSNISEGFRKRRYPKPFVAKLIDSEGEAAETMTWLKFACACKYISIEVKDRKSEKYDCILGKLVNMGRNPQQWQY
ncbi:four helix bundle protein [Cyclobacterium plantarum]|uniref:Four helix bundle protein n=1 Tax=Cyclobacterium plantarum TaxID=2716263 RepID=A0ABX0H9G7_9BACT|nr:four helix bundle protein [Cyclobacterium plantarum]NHE58272.1 four helix bundle protein [Cyclobacterium plantarum]